MSDQVAKLEAEGWKRQFIASGHRLSKAMSDYEMLGMETTTVPARYAGCGDCTVCFDDVNDDSAMIFTREGGKRTDDDLF